MQQSPVAPNDLQLSLLPLHSPVNLVLHATRLVRRVERLALLMSAYQYDRVLGELALVEMVLDRIEHFQERALVR